MFLRRFSPTHSDTNSPTARTRSQAGRRKARSRPLLLEPLEDRVTPTVIVWTNRLTATDTFTPDERAVIDQAINIWDQLTTAIGYPAQRVGVNIVGGVFGGINLGGPAGIGGGQFDSRGSTGGGIELDSTGGGFGWFIDPTPWESSEFPTQVNPSVLGGGPQQTDLLSVVLHEMCHVLGFNAEPQLVAHMTPGPGLDWTYHTSGGAAIVFESDLSHLDPAYEPDDLMNPVADAGKRYFPSLADLTVLADVFHGPTQLAGDWNGDKKWTPGVFDPSSATWYLSNSNPPPASGVIPSTNPFAPPDPNIFQFGAPGLVPVVGDWDGNGTTTVGEFNPVTATWYLKNSNSGGAADLVFQFGLPGWTPVVGDWDGNGTTTVGMVDPLGNWYLRNSNSSGPADLVFNFGGPGTVPVTGDWDGNGTTTAGVFVPSAGVWFLKSSNSPFGGVTSVSFGGPGLTPITGDWGGTGRTQLGVVIPGNSTWVLRNTNAQGVFSGVTLFTFDPTPSPLIGYIPVAGDWDGNGTVTVGLYDTLTGMWTLRNSNTSDRTGTVTFQFGLPGWLPVVGDWDGNGTTTVGVFDPSSATFYLRNENSAGTPDAGVFQFGAPGWKPVAGNWTGNGKWTVGVFDPTFGNWYLKLTNGPGGAVIGPVQFGGSGVIPVTGDWDGNGTTTIGVYDEGSGAWLLKNSNFPGGAILGPVLFGAPGLLPVTGDWDGNRTVTLGVLDSSSGYWYLTNQLQSGPPDVPTFS